MYYRKDDNPFTIIFISIFIIAVLLFINSIIGATEYNDGICTNCGGTYEFKQAIGHQSFTYYMYVCNQCGRAIEISEYYPPK